MIFVCNKKNMPKIEKDAIVVNIMRPSIFSNDYSHNSFSAAKIIVETRAKAIEMYQHDFLIKSKGKGLFRDELIKLFRLAKKHHIYLMCACAPLPCHGYVIKKFLEDHLGDQIYK